MSDNASGFVNSILEKEGCDLDTFIRKGIDDTQENGRLRDLWLTYGHIYWTPEDTLKALKNLGSSNIIGFYHEFDFDDQPNVNVVIQITPEAPELSTDLCHLINEALKYENNTCSYALQSEIPKISREQDTWTWVNYLPGKMKTIIKKQDRAKMRLVPGGKLHADNIFQFPAYYPSQAIFKHLQPDYPIDLEEIEADILDCRKPYQDHGTVMFEHQAIAFNFIHCKRSALIADAPGVGKTLPAIFSIPKGGSSVVIAPASLLSAAWLSQIEEFRPELDAVIVRGNKRQREKLLEADADVYIISYDSARTHSSKARYGSMRLTETDKRDGLLNRFWDLIILDEAHRIKNPKSKTARMCWKLAEDCDKRVALTGTPISNSPVDIWSIFRFLDPDIWTSRSKFIDLFLEVHMERIGSREFQRIGGVHPPMQNLFDKLINFYMLRRTLDEVADPPEVIRQTRYAPMLQAQSAQYKTLKKDSQIFTADKLDYIIDAEPLTKSQRLHQIAQSSLLLEPDVEAEQGYSIRMSGESGKIQTLKDTLQDIPDDEQVVIFTQSRQLARHALAAIENSTIIDGQVDAKTREKNMAAFIAGDHKYLIATLGALSEGVTLNNASTCIFLQRSFSFVHSVQAEARIRRLNSESETVRIIDIVTENTIDELPAKAIKDKTGMFKQIIEDPRERLKYA